MIFQDTVIVVNIIHRQSIHYLFPDAELRKYRSEHFFGSDDARDRAERGEGGAEVFGQEVCGEGAQAGADSAERCGGVT